MNSPAATAHLPVKDESVPSVGRVVFRLRIANAIDASVAVVIGTVVGVVYFFVSMMVVIGWSSPISGAVGSSMVEYLRMRDPVEVGLPFVLIAVMIAIAPRAIRQVLERRPRPVRRHRWRTKHTLPLAMITMSAAVVVPAASFQSWQTAALAISSCLSIVGMQAIALAFVARRGTRVVCARCEYAVGSWSSAAHHCSECGHAWKAAHGVRFGLRRYSWKFALGGVALLAVSGLAVAAVTTFGLRGI